MNDDKDSGSGQSVTRATYEDPTLVQAFLARNGAAREEDEVPAHIRNFAQSLAGNRLIDIGCGPGIDARRFARLGLKVVGVDYSDAMVRAAKESSAAANPEYRQLDMRALDTAFAGGSFDGAWVSASLIHIPEADVPTVLAGIHHVLTPSGRVRITLKAGPHGPQLVHDDKYGIGIDREFIFWQEENFAPMLQAAGLEIEHIERYDGGITGTNTTSWLMFSARAVKR
jgi:SAM-dependent methyltransferase